MALVVEAAAPAINTRLEKKMFNVMPQIHFTNNFTNVKFKQNV